MNTYTNDTLPYWNISGIWLLLCLFMIHWTQYEIENVFKEKMVHTQMRFKQPRDNERCDDDHAHVRYSNTSRIYGLVLV